MSNVDVGATKESTTEGRISPFTAGWSGMAVGTIRPDAWEAVERTSVSLAEGM